MKFDITSARSAGYSDDEIADYLASQNNFDLGGALKSGYSASDVISFLSGADAPAAAPVTDTGDETARLAARYKAPEKSFLPKPMDPMGIASGRPLGAPATKAQEPVKPSKAPAPYRDRREALDDAVNLLEEGANQSQVGEAFSKAGITFDEIAAHGKKRGSEYFKQQAAPEVDPEVQRLLKRAPAPVTGEIKSTRNEENFPGADVALAGAKGAVTGFKLLMSAGGAGGRPTSMAEKALETADQYLEGLRSAAAVRDDERIGQIMEEAKDGTWSEQVIAAAKAAGVAPASLVAQGLGTSVPVILTSLLPGIRESNVARLTAQIGLGAAQGAGATKEAIYSAVRDDMLRAGVPRIEAEERAEAAQSYLGKNKDQIAIGMALGALASSTGVERVIPIGQVSNVLAKSGVSRAIASAEQNVIGRGLIGGVTEAAPEFFQGSAEQVAQNVALQREGRDVPTFQGAVGTGTLEALAGFGAGAATNAAFGRPVTPEEQIAREIDSVNLSAAPINFTPMDSPSAQAGLAPILVPVPAQQETTDVSATSVPPLAATGSGQLASDQFGGGVDLPGLTVADATGQRGGSAGAAAPDGGAADAVPTGAKQSAAGLNRPFDRATDQDLLARTEAAVAAQENNNAVVPAEQWFGRKGDGYATQVDAQQALPGRQRMFPNLGWKVEPMANGKFRLAGYSQETTSGTQAPQAIQGQAQGRQASAISGTAGTSVLQPLASGSAAQAQSGRDVGVRSVAAGPDAQARRPGALGTPEGATAAGLTAPLRLAPPAPVRAVGKALNSLRASTGVDAEMDRAPLSEQQQAASAVARLLGRTVTFLKADTPASLPNGFMLPGDSKNIFVANDADDAPLSVAMHEIYHTLPEAQRKALNTQLAQYFRQDRRAEFAEAFDYDPKNDALLDEEIPAFMVQAISKRPDFWQDLRTKMGNAEFAEVAKTILAKLNTIISGAKEQYGDEFVSKYITDVAKARDLLSTAYAQALQEQGLTPDVATTGEMMQSRRGTTKSGDYDVRTMKDGTMVVYGDPEQIRAQVPEDVKGRVTKDGIVFTNAAAPRVRAALEGRQVAYSRGGEVTEKLPMKNGRYLGAPEKFNTPGKIPTLRKILRQLADEGAPGRYWYENSSREVLKMVGGDVNEARKFVALLAIYSPQAKVDANSTFALRAWAQYKAGQPISVKTDVMDTKAKNAMDDVDAFWSGEKTGNFFFNLLREIDPSTAGKQGATIDMWMMRAGQYETDAPTGTQYSFMENETNRLAQELGWEPQQVQAAIWVAMKARMENSGVKKETERTSEKKGWIKFVPGKDGKGKVRVILNEQKHRDNWLKYSFAHDVTKDDTQQAKFDFGDGLKRHIGQVSFEARPGRTTGVLPGIHSAPYAQQVEFQQAVQKAFLDDQGNDLLAMRLGLLVDNDILAPGVWQGEISPSTQLGVAMAPAKGTKGKTNVDPAQAKALNIYAAVAGLVARQEGVGWHRPFYSSTKRDANGLDIRVGRPLNPREVADLEKAVGQWMADNGHEGWQDKFAFVSSPNGIRLVNFGIITNEKLHADVLRVTESVLPDAEAQWFASSGDMMTNDWKENQNGQDYVERTRAEGRSDVLDWARAYLAPRVQRVFDDFSERYDWGDAGELRFSQRAGDGSGRQGLGGAQDRQVQAPERADAQAVQGLSPTDALPGAPTVQGFTGPDPRLVAVAEQYARDNGITLRRQAEYAQVDPERAARIAAAYEAMPHAPNDPLVRAAYKELIAQTLAQYRALEKAGYKFWFINLDKPDNVEYASSPWNAMRDIRANKVMGVFPTDDGFGSGDFDPASNPLLEDTGIKWPSGSLFGPRKRVLANDLFRAVHDAFGHGLEGAGFRAQGEENAWQAHVRLFTGSAVAAITSETRGQNSWLNYGPNGETNRTAKVEDTVFADQKTGLLPEFAWTEGRVGDMGSVMASNRAAPDTPAFRKWFGNSKVVNADGTPKVMYHGTAQDISAFRSKQAGAIFVTSDPDFAEGFAGTSEAWMLKNYEQVLTPEQIEIAFNAAEAKARSEIDDKEVADREVEKMRNGAGLGVAQKALSEALADQMPSGPNVMPVYVSAQNPFDYDNPDHIELMQEYERDNRYSSRSISYSIGSIETGYWEEIERPVVQEAIKSLGFDGFYVEEDGKKNLAVYKPEQIKSATGNQGTFDATNPDIRKSNRRQKLSTMGQTFELPATGTIDAARIKLQDDALRMKRVIEAVKAKGGNVGEAQNFYDANTLMPGRIQAAIDDFKSNVVRPMLSRAAELGIDMDELSMYSYAKHAKERNAYIASINKRMPDGGSGMTNDEADNILQMVDLAGDTAKFEELHQALMGITSATRQIMLAEGLITPDEFASLEGAYENYIPLRGFENVDEETGVARPGVGRGVNVRGAETVRAMGRKSKAGDLIENVIRDYERVIARVEKNDVAKVLLDFVLSNPDPDLWGVDVERSKPSFNKAQGTVQYTKSIDKGEDTIGLKVGGEQVYIKFADKELTRALRQAWKDETSGLERATLAMTGWWNNWLRAVLTKYNPAFALINIPRDALWSGTASALAELGPKGLASYLAAYPKAFMASARQEAGLAGSNSRLFGNPKMDARFAEFRSAGGITGGFFMRTLDDINQEMRNELLLAGAAARNPWESIKSLPPFKLAKMTLKLLEFMGAASENATRFALYQASREQGNSPAKAGILAKDGTTNFNRKGEWGGALNNLYLFFNAAVQGNAQLFKVLKSPAVQASMAGVSGVGMMLALYGASAGGEDDDGEAYWDKIPGYIKERNMVIMLPPGDALAGGIERVGKRGRYITIPVQYGFNIFPNVGYVMADVLRNAQDPKRGMTPTKGALHLTSTVLGSANPFGGAVDVSDGVQVLLAAMPTLADLPIQLINERGTFGTPSSPSKSPFDLRPDSERMFTSQQDSVSAKIAEALNELGGGNEAKAGKILGVETSVTPGTIQTLISATTGGLGTFVEQVGSSVISMTGDDLQPKASKIPFLNKFYGEVDEGANIKTAGDRMREVKKLSDEVKAQQKLGLDPKLTSEEDRLLSLANMQATYQRQSTMIRKQELEIIKDDSKTKAEKALEKQRLQVERDKLATEMNREYLRVVPK